jgi:hypothetical protein
MSWNHRVLAHKDWDDWHFEIYEVYYDDNGIPNAYAENGVSVSGDSIKSMNWTLDKMKECLSKPILLVDGFPKEFENK